LIAEKINTDSNIPERPAESSFGKKIKKSTRVKEKLIKYFFAVNGVMALVFIILIFVFLFRKMGSFEAQTIWKLVLLRDLK